MVVAVVVVAVTQWSIPIVWRGDGKKRACSSCSFTNIPYRGESPESDSCAALSARAPSDAATERRFFKNEAYGKTYGVRSSPEDEKARKADETGEGNAQGEGVGRKGGRCTRARARPFRKSLGTLTGNAIRERRGGRSRLPESSLRASARK